MGTELLLIGALALAGLVGAVLWQRRRAREYMPPEPQALRGDLMFWYYGLQPGGGGLIQSAAMCRWCMRAAGSAAMRR